MLGNRPIAGLIETFGAGGYDTDKSGQVVSKNVIEDQENFSYLNTAYRLMGIKSMQQQKDTDAFYADKEAGEEQAARQTTRSEEHTSELQSLMRISYAVFCLKKKKRQIHKRNQHKQTHRSKTDNLVI